MKKIGLVIGALLSLGLLASCSENECDYENTSYQYEGTISFEADGKTVTSYAGTISWEDKNSNFTEYGFEAWDTETDEAKKDKYGYAMPEKIKMNKDGWNGLDPRYGDMNQIKFSSGSPKDKTFTIESYEYKDYNDNGETKTIKNFTFTRK